MAEAPAVGRPTLLVFSDDWGRHPSSSQHLVRQLLPRYRTWWVNTIGMRRPGLNRLTLLRGAGKIRDWLRFRRKPSEESANPRVLRPIMWPWFRRSHDRWLNRFLLTRQLSPMVRCCPEPVIAITTVPIVADLVGRLPVARWVYYCVDDFSKWPGMEQETISDMEARLVRRADRVIAVSPLLQERLRGWGKTSALLTHGVDLPLWRTKGHADPLPQFVDLEKPIVLFWGSIDWQMDLSFLRELSRNMEAGTIVLVGPTTDPDPALWSIPRVTHLGSVPHTQLPRMADEASVLIMPYQDAPGLRESQPLKLKEYLASGKPAVVRDLPANRAWRDALDVAQTPEEFSVLVRTRIAEGLPESQAIARLRLKDEGWAEKAGQFERMAMGLDTEASEHA